MYYSILIDECKDNAGHEELSTCFRFVNDEGKVQERFYKLTIMKETNAGVLPTSEQFAFSLTVLALGANGASVLSGCYVAAKLRDTYPWLFYVHCAAHRLNLIGCVLWQNIISLTTLVIVHETQ